MNMTSQNFFDAFTPLLLALNEKKVLMLPELAYLYEDVLAQRKLVLKEDSESLAFLEYMVQQLHRLAKGRQNDTPQT